MRKRKLYVNELLKRNTNKKIEVTILEDDIPIVYESIKDALNYYDKEQVIEWYISEYYGIVIFIK